MALVPDQQSGGVNGRRSCDLVEGGDGRERRLNGRMIRRLGTPALNGKAILELSDEHPLRSLNPRPRFSRPEIREELDGRRRQAKHAPGGSRQVR